MNASKRYGNVDDYLASVPPEFRKILNTIRTLVKTKLPEATEVISYGMPAFRDGKIFFYYAAFKKHIGIYPPVKDDVVLLSEIAPYRGEKGNLKFPLEKQVPYELIGRVAVALHKQIAG